MSRTKQAIPQAVNFSLTVNQAAAHNPKKRPKKDKMIVDLVRKAPEIGVRYTERDNIDNETVRHIRALRNVNEARIEGLKAACEGAIHA